MEDKTENLSLEIDVKSCEPKPHSGFALNSGVRSLELPLLDHRLYSFTCANCPSQLLAQLDPSGTLSSSFSLKTPWQTSTCLSSHSQYHPPFQAPPHQATTLFYEGTPHFAAS